MFKTNLRKIAHGLLTTLSRFEQSALFHSRPPAEGARPPFPGRPRDDEPEAARFIRALDFWKLLFENSSQHKSPTGAQSSKNTSPFADQQIVDEIRAHHIELPVTLQGKFREILKRYVDTNMVRFGVLSGNAHGIRIKVK